MDIYIIFLFIMLICIYLLLKNKQQFSSSETQKQKIKSINSKVDELKIKYDKLICLGYEKSIDELYYIGFDNNNKELGIKTKGFVEKIISYDKLIGVEFVENGKTTLSIGNIVTGALLANGTGAIIGAMNKKNTITDRKIRFTLNDFDNPLYEMNLLNNGDNTGFWEDIVFEANKIMNTVKYIIDNK